MHLKVSGRVKVESMKRIEIVSLLALLAVLSSTCFAEGTAPAPTLPDPAVSTKESPEKIWAGLMAGNRRFVEGKPAVKDLAKRREELQNSQSPQVIVVTCSDSRVSPELVFDENLGDLFVIRTAGNIADKVALGSIEYAQANLKSYVLVVLGHDKCGAVKAALSGEKMPSKNLDAIVKQIEPALKEPKKAGLAGDLLAQRAIESNITQSANDIIKQSEILQKAVAEGKLTVIKAIYRLNTGEVVRLVDAKAVPVVKE
jgi:carbonic anhydrase